MRYRTLKDVDRASLHLRAWCFACARGELVDPIWWEEFERRGWSIELLAATRRFRCAECGSSSNVLLLPARRPVRPKTTGADLVAKYFHAARSVGKKNRRR